MLATQNTDFGKLNTEPTPLAYEIGWQPIPNSSQELAISCPCAHILYEGARGPGKTITQLMRFASRVGLGYGKFWKGVIFDREFDNLSGLVTESKKWFPVIFPDSRFMESNSAYKWVFATGEELLFRHVKKPADYDGFHGHEYPFLGWNELTKYPTSDLYDKFMSVNRSTFTPERDTPKDDEGRYKTEDGNPLPKIPLEVFSTTNPNGPGHNWVKRRFIDAAPRGTIVRTEVEVFNPQTQELCTVTKTQVAIFGSYRENIYLPPEYVAELESITDENLRRAWLYGDWDIVTGGAFDDVWSRKTHVLPRFVIPHSWAVDRAFDWGSTHPYSVGWWAEANGEEATIIFEGQEFSFCPPKGSLIQLFELYGSNEIGTNKGLKKSAGDIALEIKSVEESLLTNGWITTKPLPGPADNQIDSKPQSDEETIHDKMKAKGVHWEHSDKSPGSRVNGMQLLRDRLEAAVKGKEEPHIYFMENCKASLGTIPTLPRDDKKLDDVDTTSEDHAYDMCRYRVLKSSTRYAGKGVKIRLSYG